MPVKELFHDIGFSSDYRFDQSIEHNGEYIILERTVDNLTQEIRFYLNGEYYSLGDGTNPETFYDLKTNPLIEVKKVLYIDIEAIIPANTSGVLYKLYEFQGESAWVDYKVNDDRVEISFANTFNDEEAHNRFRAVVEEGIIRDKELRKEIGQLLSRKEISLSQLFERYGKTDPVILEINKVSSGYDYDNDGLLDYYEVYRNFTDPDKPDTDGDGILDGDWEERADTKEMFYRRYHGSCSTTSAFYSTIFQALGIPMKVMPIATTIDTGKIDEDRESKYQLLYKFRVSQSENFQNQLVRDTWLKGLEDYGSNHIMSYVYLGNRWINVDIAGGQRFNTQPISNQFILFHKTAAYDFRDTLDTITTVWLLGEKEFFDRVNRSENFSESAANSISNNYANFTLKVFDIRDKYGEHIKEETLEYIDSWQERDHIIDIWRQ